MATWNSRGLRGSTLEELVNRTNEQYREKGLALDPEDSYPHHTGEVWIRTAAISHWPILTRGVPWII